MTYFVDDFDTQDKRAVLIWARDDHDPFDQWGWVMSWLFDIAGEIYENRPGVDVPRELQYRPGAGGVEISEDRAEGLALLSDDALVWAARVMSRFENCLRNAGENY